MKRLIKKVVTCVQTAATSIQEFVAKVNTWAQNTATSFQESVTEAQVQKLRMNSTYDLVLLLVLVAAAYTNDQNVSDLFGFVVTNTRNMVQQAFTGAGTL